MKKNDKSIASTMLFNKLTEPKTNPQENRLHEYYKKTPEISTAQ
jgi:hypothetical protein